MTQNRKKNSLPPFLLNLHQQSCVHSPYLLSSHVKFSSVRSLSHVQLFVMNHGMPGLPVHHQPLEFTQTHVHWVSDAIQPSHPLSSPSPPALNLSQHQGLFKWVSSSHQVAKVLEFQLQNQSFQWTPSTDYLWDGLVGSPWSPRDSQESSWTPQFKSISSSVLNFLYSPTLTCKVMCMYMYFAYTFLCII